MLITSIYLWCDLLVSMVPHDTDGNWRDVVAGIFSALAVLFAGLAVRKQRELKRDE